jgi:broad specificity phosphatase PhoE
MQTRLILIRHGETDWNAQKRYMGSTDIGLNERGLAQAGALKQKLSGQTIDSVYSSDAKRALRFAEQLFNCRLIEATSELREMGFGVFEGMRYDDITAKHPELYRNWIDNPFGVDIPGGEKAGEFRDRIMKTFQKIAEQGENKTSAVVTHGGPIGMFLKDALGFKDIWSAMPETGEMNMIEREKGGRWVRSHLL